MQNNAANPIARSLKRLSIDRSQRPNTTGRSWLVMLVIALGVTSIAAGAGWWYYKTTGVNIIASVAEKPVAVRMYEIPRARAEGESAIALVANGKIVSDVLVNVATKVSGQITSLHVEQGDAVNAGQVLARIEDDVYKAQRDEAKATVDRLERSIDRSEADHRKQLATIEEARSDRDWRKYMYDRLKRLEGDALAGDVELVEARHLYESAAAALEVATAAADSTRSAIEVIKADLEAAESVLQLRQIRLDDCAILAPITGVVLERNAQIGDFLAAEGGRGANANAQLVSIADMTRLRVEIDVSERDIHRVSAGQKARIFPDAYKAHSYNGHVMWVDPLGDYARATVQVKVRIEEPGAQLRVEGSAKVEFLDPEEVAADDAADRYWLPLDAVQIPSQGAALVFTVIDDRAVANRVKIGARTDKTVEVTSGVYSGMKIIADQLDEIQAGTLVTIQE